MSWIAKLIFLGAILLIIFEPYGLPVQAAEMAGVNIQPSVIEEKVNPGQLLSLKLHITNLGLEEQTFYIIKRDIVNTNAEGHPIFAMEGESNEYELSNWIQITNEPIIIAGGRIRDIPFTITVPQNASPGGHFGTIFLTLSSSRPEKTGASVGYQVGTIINLRISGDIREDAGIREFRADKWIYSKPAVNLITRVENLGNVTIRPRGPVEIFNVLGKKVTTLIMNESGASVFPRNIRQFETAWNYDGIAFGRYQAIMSLIYGDELKQTMTKTAIFWVLPLKVILPIIGSLLLLILGIYIFVKLHIRKKIRELNIPTNSTSAISRKHVPISHLSAVVAALLVFTLLFIIVLFFLFA